VVGGKEVATFRNLYRSFAKRSLGDRAFLAANFLLVTATFAVFFYPLAFIVSASFSGSVTVMGGALIPSNISLVGYKTVFEYPDIWRSYMNSAVYLALGTTVSLALTILLAYPLSRKDFKGKNFVLVICMITMYFNGGIIPTYLTMRDYQLLDTIWAVILPGALSIYNMIIMRTYFVTQIPDEMLESSQLDGCGNIRYLFSMILPMSGPIIAVVMLFSAVTYWNSYFGPMMYLSSRPLYPLTLITREILVMNTQGSASQSFDPEQLALWQERQNVMKYALIVVSSLPVLIIYPFVQKHFVKGIMIGAVKG
jgi:ABC-type glycerol-3-phosphate transport system permease component